MIWLGVALAADPPASIEAPGSPPELPAFAPPEVEEPPPIGRSKAAREREVFLRWADQQERATVERGPSEGYRFAADVWSEIASLTRELPGRIQPERIGSTGQGRPVWAFHVVDPERPPERKVLVFGGLHALEWIGVEVAADVLRWASTASLDASVTVIPLVNADGRAKVERDLSLGENRYRRGNLKNVDLNRDFAVNAEPTAIWEPLLPGYYASSERPLSQPESRAIDGLAARELYDRSVSLHAFGAYLYYPWSGRFCRPPDRRDFRQLGRAMAKAQGPRRYTTRQLGRWAFFFRAQGSEIDHLYGQYGTRAFLIELTRSGLQPFHPSTWRSYFRWYNPEDPVPHREQGLEAVQALVQAPQTEGERLSPAGTPREPCR